MESCTHTGSRRDMGTLERFRGNQGRTACFTGTYREITPPARVVFGSPAPGGGECLGTLEFEERADQTTLTLTMTAPSRKARDAMLEMRIDAGTERTLDNLGEYLAKKSQTR